MRAGPHVKALCEAADAPAVQHALDRTPGVIETLVAAPGPGVSVSVPLEDVLGEVFVG